ncbi:hypothetical protein J8273_1563 [Carpediemonas membranifera]|uniref:Uncharacterized protein n=1 Tax=Carpediemonas membranifera TaxID=201153 RepID=A0A8J6B1P3_9EUKA|nr:hypothetical protein J8273_1563 [Carpediemonas membranifera]|eukprot:KAG9396555.1 hypothetical protein J8273_1563 [Carpediemonas membranifera]
MENNSTIVLSMGDRQVISGSNDYGQLGLGHTHQMTGFEALPFRVDQIMPFHYSTEFNVFLSGGQLLFTGLVTAPTVLSGLLPGFSKDDDCLTATPLRFPESARAFCCYDNKLIWVSEGRTHVSHTMADGPGRTFTVPFEVVAVADSAPIRLRHASGQWFSADMAECDVPVAWATITPVSVDAWV